MSIRSPTKSGAYNYEIMKMTILLKDIIHVTINARLLGILFCVCLDFPTYILSMEALYLEVGILLVKHFKEGSLVSEHSFSLF